MPVTDVSTDPQSLTLTLVAEVAAPVDRVWHAFTDARRLERFWGPPGWPAVFTALDPVVGGAAHYAMTGPRGERSAGSWRFLAVDPPRSFTVVDSFAGDDGEPVPGLPQMEMEFVFTAHGSGTRLTNTTRFPSAEALDQVLAMGAVEGSTMAMNQLDTALRGLREHPAAEGTRMEEIDDTHVRVTRLLEGTRDQLWRAHHDPELVRRWMLGPDGWTMTVCEPPTEVGADCRYSWAPEEGTEGEPFGFEGEVLLEEPPRRSVTTERMQGTEGPTTLNDLTLYEEDGLTLLTLDIEYPDRDTRDEILATGMLEGMEAGYARLERLLRAG